jgi:hypothetical protein
VSKCTTGGLGVTIVFTGPAANKIGTLTVQGGGTVTLNAPYTNNYNAGFDGVLFYMDIRAPLGTKVAFQGGSITQLTGGIFFPSAEVDFTGSSQASTSNCLVVVGDFVQITGSSQYSTTFSTAGCAADNVPTTQTQVGPATPKLVE